MEDKELIVTTAKELLIKILEARPDSVLGRSSKNLPVSDVADAFKTLSDRISENNT
ncbi:MAG: hypothetical protein GY749_46585 [Desulfobacteraceae bacterium]|nr:hypothetical protein [Desulfobacteraceae bacterium]